MSVLVPAGPDRCLGLRMTAGASLRASEELVSLRNLLFQPGPNAHQPPLSQGLQGIVSPLDTLLSPQAAILQVMDPAVATGCQKRRKNYPGFAWPFLLQLFCILFFLNILIKFVFLIQKIKLIFKFAIVPSIKFGHHSWFFLIFSMCNCVCATLWHCVFFIIMTKFTVLYAVPPS